MKRKKNLPVSNIQKPTFLPTQLCKNISISVRLDGNFNFLSWSQILTCILGWTLTEPFKKHAEICMFRVVFLLERKHLLQAHVFYSLLKVFFQFCETSFSSTMKSFPVCLKNMQLNQLFGRFYQILNFLWIWFKRFSFINLNIKLYLIEIIHNFKGNSVLQLIQQLINHWRTTTNHVKKMQFCNQCHLSISYFSTLICLIIPRKWFKMHFYNLVICFTLYNKNLNRIWSV